MEYTIRLSDKRLYEAILGLLSHMHLPVKGRPSDDSKALTTKSNDRFRIISIKTKGHRFNREEANER
jgi:hypothetical protein